MKKLLLSLFAVFFAVMAKAEATDVVFDFDNEATELFGISGRSNSNGSSEGDITDAVTAKLDGVSLIVDPSTTNTPNRLWEKSPVLRMYSGTITVYAPGHSISKIEFEGNSNFNMTANVGTLEGKVWGTTDKVSEVIFTVSKNTQLKSMTVTLDGAGEAPQPVEIAGSGEGTENSPYDVERALSILANQMETSANVYVAGTITEITDYSLEYGNATYNIGNGQMQIVVFRGKYLDGKTFDQADLIKVGDSVLLCGVLKNYTKDGVTTPEITGSSIVKLNGATTPDTPDDPVTPVDPSESTEVEFDFDNTATQLLGIDGRSNSNGSSDGDILEAVTAKLDGVSVTIDPSSTTTPNRLWEKAPVLRMYSGDLTVAAPGHNITKIEFVGNSNFNVTANCGALEGKIWTADTKVSQVVFTVSKNTQISSIIVTLDGEISETPQPVEIAGTGEGTVESPYDVERALSILENGKETADNVYVAGTITAITDYSLEYGNATYTISNGQLEIMVFRGKYLDGKAFDADDMIKVGDAVVVCGVLKNYVKDGVTTPEITGSSIYSLNGETAPEQPAYVPVGDGTKANPYTVEDIIGMNILESDGQQYWVKGVIIGNAASATKLNEGDKISDTNIALAATEASSVFVPVALPAGDMRSLLGVATNPDNVGKDVIVLGTLEKYFSVAGVKNVSAAIIDGRETTAIISVATDNAPVRYYNIQGVEVANPQAGQLYIRVQGDKATKVIK